ncbi:hypothetical protein O6H91_11G000800 [Diphasiastrum complanatum]|uniref:Uncharacterized protein n=1 Tax=Diphasiastrum complanatum TaxID=34168 RepID=A0ACC2C5K0_DIPCM|nr:hypothetical protein O6H91_11G000800 [Diphasiastrum complanatum]
MVLHIWQGVTANSPATITHNPCTSIFSSSLPTTLPKPISLLATASKTAFNSKKGHLSLLVHTRLLQRHLILTRNLCRDTGLSPETILCSALSRPSFFSTSRSVNCIHHVRAAFRGKAHDKGRVGIYTREGNISLASFGLKLKRDRQGQNIDITKSLSMMLPYIVVATAVIALSNPASFSWVRKDLYAPLLGGIMLSIGIQLSIADFAIVFQTPLPLLIGYVAQYALKPLLGLVIAQAFSVPPLFYSGFILTACVSGAQLSSYAAFLSGGDVALSIILTSLTTISSVVITPALTGTLIGSIVPVDVVAMAKSILQVVFLPIFIGLALNTYAKPIVDYLRPLMPLLAMFCTSLCIGSPLALNQGTIVCMEGLQLLFPVLVFHAGSFLLGYSIARFPTWRHAKLNSSHASCNTISWWNPSRASCMLCGSHGHNGFEFGFFLGEYKYKMYICK